MRKYGCGRKKSRPNLEYYPNTGGTVENNGKNSFRIAGLQAEIRTRSLSNTKEGDILHTVYSGEREES
jgi:hypothetical protein